MVCAVERNAGYGGNDTEGDLISLVTVFAIASPGTFIAFEKRVMHKNDIRAFQYEKCHICDRLWQKRHTGAQL